MTDHLSHTERRAPTHVLRFEVPLHLEEQPTVTDFDPVQDAFQIMAALSRAAYVEAICDDAQLSLIEWPKEPVELHAEPDDLRRAALWVVDNWDCQSSQHMSMPALRRALGCGVARHRLWATACMCDTVEDGWRPCPPNLCERSDHSHATSACKPTQSESSAASSLRTEP